MKRCRLVLGCISLFALSVVLLGCDTSSPNDPAVQDTSDVDLGDSDSETVGNNDSDTGDSDTGDTDTEPVVVECSAQSCDVNATCDDTTGVIECTCNEGFEGDGHICNDIDSCAGNPCFAGVACSDVAAPGTGFVCGDCPTGYWGDGEHCEDLDACALQPCFIGAECQDESAPGTGYVCGACPNGYEGDGVTCTDIDGCAADPCTSGVQCNDIPAPGTGFICSACPAGFEGDGVTCTDIDGCTGDPCFAGVSCTDIAAPGTGYTCSACPAGFEGDGVFCNDINGCASNPCAAGVECVDVAAPGTGFTCGTCPAGYEGDGVTCTDIDSCAGDPCFAGVACTDLAAPEMGYACGACPTGYVGDGTSCVDMDACAGNPCFPGAECTDHAAPDTGYTCGSCPAGFEGDGISCTDIDGCAGDPCAMGVQCNDVPAPGIGFICSDCPAGFEGDGVTCTDIDGCTGDPCFAGVACTDLPAPQTGFTCGVCPAGYEGNGIFCSDIDECASDPCFPGVDCTDNPAPASGFTCGTCPTGYEGDGTTCTDIDACAGDPCFPGVTCTDRAAPSLWYTCGACPSGYEGNGYNCTDIDGCADSPCFPGADCTDIPAPGVGHVCGGCPAGFEGDGTNCTDLCFRYVNAQASGVADGMSWENAFTDLQAALASADTATPDICPNGVEVWIAEGVYTPTEGVSRDIEFELAPDMALYGGFPGSGSPTWDDRDWEAYETVLSGDIGAVGDPTDNSRNILQGADGVVLDGMTITGSYDGSALVAHSADITFFNLKFVENHAGSHWGGAIDAWLGDFEFNNCQFEGNSGRWAGALDLSQINASFSGCTFTGNTAVEEGGAIVHGGNHLTIDNCRFEDNAVEASWGYPGKGGALYTQCYEELTISNSQFIGNSAQSSEDDGAEIYGGALYLVNTADKLISGCTFQNNASEFGGAISTHSSLGSLRIFDSHFIENSATWKGGAAYVRGTNTKVVVDSCMFDGNQAGWGGALDLNGSEIVINSDFSNNTAAVGGAIDSFYGAPLIAGSRLQNNEATAKGGAMRTYWNSALIVNSVLTGNNADQGGAVYCQYGGSGPAPVRVVNSTISENAATTRAGGIYSSVDLEVVNSIVWGNDAPPRWDYELEAMSVIQVDGNASVTFSNIGNSAASGVGNISMDPWFVDPANGDYQLAAGSPCIDAGDDTQAPFGDALASSRVDDLSVANCAVPGDPECSWITDMGAYEHGSTNPPGDPICGDPIQWTENGHNYWNCPVRMSWRTASNYCWYMGGHLVSIETVEEQDFITSLIDRDTWIGASEDLINDTWQWESESVWTYEYWESTQPDGSFDEDCAAMVAPSGEWHDRDCYQQLTFVCESN